MIVISNLIPTCSKCKYNNNDICTLHGLYPYECDKPCKDFEKRKVNIGKKGWTHKANKEQDKKDKVKEEINLIRDSLGLAFFKTMRVVIIIWLVVEAIKIIIK